MLPVDPLQRARNRAWIEFASKTLDSIAAFYGTASEADFQKSVDTLKSSLLRLEHALGDGPWFNGSIFSLVDAAFGPVFRYFDVIDRYADLNLFADTPRVCAWREALSRRISVQRAAVDDYAPRLVQFILARRSVLAQIISRQAA